MNTNKQTRSAENIFIWCVFLWCVNEQSTGCLLHNEGCMNLQFLALVSSLSDHGLSISCYLPSCIAVFFFGAHLSSSPPTPPPPFLSTIIILKSFVKVGKIFHVSFIFFLLSNFFSFPPRWKLFICFVWILNCAHCKKLAMSVKI